MPEHRCGRAEYFECPVVGAVRALGVGAPARIGCLDVWCLHGFLLVLDCHQLSIRSAVRGGGYRAHLSQVRKSSRIALTESECPDTGPGMTHYAYCADNAEIMPTLTPGFDLVFFDPPYNTGRGSERHSYRNSFSTDEWVAHTETRLRMAWDLMAEDSVLIVTIDERSLGEMLMMLARLTTTTPNIVSARTQRSGTYRPGFRRTGEFFLFVHRGQLRPKPAPLGPEWGLTGKTATGLDSTAGDVRWNPMFRSGAENGPESAPGCVYPVYVAHRRITGIGHGSETGVDGEFAVWPTNGRGEPGRWRLRPEKARALFARGLMYAAPTSARGRTPIYYLPKGQVESLDAGHIVSGGLDDYGVQRLRLVGERSVIPGTTWDVTTHDYSVYGTQLLRKLVPGSAFTHPKSLYAVADAMRFYPARRVLDAYAGSGTTAHALMAINATDGGDRESVSIALNEAGQFCDTLVPRLRAATITALAYTGLLGEVTRTLPGEVECPHEQETESDPEMASVSAPELAGAAG